MVEGPLDKPKEKPTPHELNEQFCSLWSFLPRDAFEEMRRRRDFDDLDPVLRPSVVSDIDFSRSLEDYCDEVNARMASRSNSETLQKLVAKLENLLNQASITNSFRRRIIEIFKINYEFGADSVEQTDSPEGALDFLGGNYTWMFDRKCPDCGGIFNPERAKKLDSAGYRLRLQSQFFVQRVLEVGYEKRGLSLKEQAETEIKHKEKYGHSELEKELQVWRQEHIDKYQDEP